jgi:hypothetical protein
MLIWRVWTIAYSSVMYLQICIIPVDRWSTSYNKSIVLNYNECFQQMRLVLYLFDVQTSNISFRWVLKPEKYDVTASSSFWPISEQ